MSILDLIEFADPIGNELVHRVPGHGSGEFRLGSQCIVREGQVALFAHNGTTADVFGPGRHTLTTYNIPLLGGLIGAAFGGRSPFRAEVYYISMRTFIDLKWGTTQPIIVRDAQLGPVRLRAFGAYAMEVSNPLQLVAKLVAARGLYTTADIENFLRTIIIQRLTNSVAEFMMAQRLSILDLASQYNELAALVAAALHDEFAQFGLKLTNFYISAVTLPEEVEKRLDAASGVSMFGGLDGYTRYKAAEALGNVGGGDAASAVVGVGLGTNLGGLLAQQFTTPAAPAVAAAPATVACVKCQAALMAGARFCSNCGASQQPASCVKCQTTLAAGARFCSNCGTAT